MFITTSVYFLMLFLIFWSYCGYLITLVLFVALAPRKNQELAASAEMPRIAIIIPCLNEEKLVEQKVANLKDLQYDQNKLGVFFLHGLSEDDTGNRIATSIRGLSNWHLMETKCNGKIYQINHGLAKVRSDYDVIVSTDMDAMLASDVLLKFAREFNTDKRVAVVGANISPENCIPFEQRYWQDQNILRLIESTVYTSSIVVAPCYAYKAAFIERFPEDCIADDIFIAFKANTEGYLTKYLESAKGTELRTPQTLEQFLRHKFRKGNAYLVELFRILYRLPLMPGWFKVIYGTKVLQLAVIPWMLPYFVLATISLTMSGEGLRQVALFGSGTLFVSLVVTSFMMNRARKMYADGALPRMSPGLRLFILSNMLLILVGLSYPFYRQTSSYSRLCGKMDVVGA